MAIKDILVHVTDAGDGDGRMATAVALARAHEAHVTGLYTLWIPPMPGYVQAELGEELLVRQRESYKEMAQAARHAFEDQAAAAGVPAEWRHSEGDPVLALNVNARYFDLVVMGQHEHPHGDSALHTVENVVLQSGKAVLVMPEHRPERQPGQHVMAAWSATRESSRAIDAALPLLVAAQRVDVIAVNARRETADAHGPIPAADLSRHLARHGVRAEAHSMDSGGHPVGETLLGRAVADGVDLLVMGAYGHSRWREMVLGGATEYVLHHARIPVLMAH